MSGGAIVLIVVVVIVLLALIGGLGLALRRRRLQQQFGPEYERVLAEQDSRLRAEAELTDRQRRVRSMDIKPLSDAARQRYSAQWLAVQETFVDAPQRAVLEAYDLVTSVMTERGYPIEDDDQMQADLSVDHAETVSHFRAARQITTTAAEGSAQTEDLRQALIHYRALFSDLLGESEPALAAQNGTPLSNQAAADAEAVPAEADPVPEGTVADTPTYNQQRR
jgi:hypothetical protein